MANGSYLVHYGIPKQKWGVRRFQNPDGTLTTAGKERYSQKGFDKMYKKDVKKLQKLDDKANLKLQRIRSREEGTKAKRAAAVGVTSFASAAGAQFLPFKSPIESTTVISPKESVHQIYPSLNNILSAVGIVAAKVAFVDAGVHAAKSLAAKHRTSVKGHEKAVAKRKALFKTMQETYKDTPYAELLKQADEQIKKNR